MSPRHLRLLTLMSRRAHGDVAKTSAEIGQLRNREIQQFDMMDRLGRILEDSSRPAAAPMRAGELSAAHFMGQTLAQHIRETRQQMARAQERRVALQQTLNAQAQRQAILAERAEMTRRSIADAQSEKLESRLPTRRKP